MKGILAFSTAVATFGLATANPLARAACNADTCARAVTGTSLPSSSRSSRLADCSSFLSTTVIPYSTSTVTVHPSAATTTVVVTTVTVRQTLTTASVWPTTINSEVYANDKRVAAAAAVTPTTQGACSLARTVVPTNLPSYASSACTSSARFSSACSCAGVKASVTTLACDRETVTVTGSAKSTITERATATSYEFPDFVTATFTTALVDKIPCGQTFPNTGSSSYKVNCEVQPVNHGDLYRTVTGTDWDNCIALDHGYAAQWEFDLSTNTCYYYTAGNDPTKTTPRKNFAYAYVVPEE